MVEGVLIAESIRAGCTLEGVSLTVRTLTRWRNPQPAPGQPPVWTIMTFQADVEPDELAQALQGVLDAPGWYADFAAGRRKYVVFPERVFDYERGDTAGRAEAAAYGTSVGVPDEQLDWGE